MGVYMVTEQWVTKHSDVTHPLSLIGCPLDRQIIYPLKIHQSQPTTWQHHDRWNGDNAITALLG